ncbi:hypothetical protein PsorP6_014926 [Peronosclerospora sorghi]|uniref:Uncharacterized protein n=1 Tax=Peronosclerospora sorghi TaxID=230839 RepID=A0ACC0VT98_9STRA|nr:hypothetical protein PsorP6_014926 [Peronosclerospora sorghi]
MALPAPWLSYKTQDGKVRPLVSSRSGLAALFPFSLPCACSFASLTLVTCLLQEYYYNPETKVTTWTRPSGSGSSVSSKLPSKQERPHVQSSRSPARSAGRGGLLAQIQQGTKLKKVETVEKTLFASGSSSSPSAPRASSSAPTRAASEGGMGAMMAAIQSGGHLRKTAPPRDATSSKNPKGPNLLASSSSSNGTGGFADIMRRNREAAARKAASTGAMSSSAPRASANELGTSGASIESRLVAIERKLDTLLTHFGLSARHEPGRHDRGAARSRGPGRPTLRASRAAHQAVAPVAAGQENHSGTTGIRTTVRTVTTRDADPRTRRRAHPRHEAVARSMTHARGSAARLALLDRWQEIQPVDGSGLLLRRRHFPLMHCPIQLVTVAARRFDAAVVVSALYL